MAKFVLRTREVGPGSRPVGFVLTHKDMKTRLVFLLFALLATSFAHGQDVTTRSATATPDHEVSTADVDAASRDTLMALPLMTEPAFLLRAPGFDGVSPFWAGTDGTGWLLHTGFNANLSFSVTAGLGSHAPRGVGFGQRAAFAYALPLSDRFSVAAGVYADNFDWGAANWRDGGVAAAVAYRLTDVVSIYGYGTKSFMPKKRNYFGPPLPAFLNPGGDRIGAMVDFKVGRNASIQVSVERGSQP